MGCPKSPFGIPPPPNTKTRGKRRCSSVTASLETMSRGEQVPHFHLQAMPIAPYCAKVGFRILDLPQISQKASHRAKGRVKRSSAFNCNATQQTGMVPSQPGHRDAHLVPHKARKRTSKVLASGHCMRCLDPPPLARLTPCLGEAVIQSTARGLTAASGHWFLCALGSRGLL